MENKICPFMSRPLIATTTPNYSTTGTHNTASLCKVECIHESCMAWLPEKTVKEPRVWSGGDMNDTTEHTIPGKCRLIP